MIMLDKIKKDIENFNIKKLLKNGELYMFDTKLTKEEHDIINKNFAEMLKQSEEKDNKQILNQEVIKQEDLDEDDITQLINLKNNLS